MKYTRRRFITSLGAASAFMMLPSVSNFASPLFKDNKKKLGVALVGLGNYATHQLAPSLQETSNCYLAGIVTGTPSKIETWKSRYNIPDANIYNYENFDKIADNKSIDVVYVVLPNSMHHEFVIRAAKAGKHVFCEKPMAVSVKECQEMIDACKKADVRLFIGYRLHSSPHHQAAMKFRDQVGPIKIVESEFGFQIGDPAQWRLKKSLAGGGAMMDLGIYAIQGARYSIGKEPVSVLAQEYKTDPEKFREVDETIIWQMEFPDGAVSNSATSYSTMLNRLYISAGRDWLELRPSFDYHGIRGSSSRGGLDNLPDINEQAAQMDTHSKCIMDNLPSDADGEEGMKDMKVIEAIYRSIKSGKNEKV